MNSRVKRPLSDIIAKRSTMNRPGRLASRSECLLFLLFSLSALFSQVSLSQSLFMFFEKYYIKNFDIHKRDISYLELVIFIVVAICG